MEPSQAQDRIRGSIAWEPSPVHYLTPTIVIFCGSLSEIEVSSLQQAVQRRLAPSIPLDVVRWAYMPANGDVSKENVREWANPLLDLEFRRRLVSLGYVRNLPRDVEPVSLQAIAVYDFANIESRTASKFLYNLAILLRDALPNVSLSLTLIAIGEGDLVLEQEVSYWPRIRLQEIAFGGALTTRSRVLEVCETIVVSLIASEVTKVIDQLVGPDRETVKWITVGASALIVDLERMREFTRLLLLGTLIRPFIANELTPVVRQRAEHAIERGIDAFWSAMLESALRNQAMSKDWDGSNQGRCITRFDLLDGDLAKELRDSKDDLHDYLRVYYIALRNILQDELDETTKRHCELLVSDLKYLLDHNTPRPSSGLLPFSLDEPLPSGLGATLHAVKHATNGLMDAPNPFIGSEYHLAAVADSDSKIARAKSRIFTRLARTFLSPLGVFLKLVPAWPLLAGSLVAILSWEVIQSAVVSSLLLAALGGTEWLVWRYLIERQRKRTESEKERQIKRSVLRLLAKISRDYRQRVIARLNDIRLALERLDSVLRVIDLDINKKIDELERQSKSHEADVTTLYRLVDFKRCREFAFMGMDRANVNPLRFLCHPPNLGQTADSFANMTTAIVAIQVFPLFQESASYLPAIREIHCVAQRIAENHFDHKTLLPHALTGAKEDLKDGKQWSWLYQKAHPLGRAGSGAAKSFTFMIVERDEEWRGAFGEESVYWSADWAVARSRQAHEVICLRGVLG